MSKAMQALKDFLSVSPSVVFPDEVLELLEPVERENDELKAENAKLRELVQEAVDAASLNDMRDWRYGKRLAFLREARELGIEVE